MFKTFRADLSATFMRRHFFLYDFFDGTNDVLWAGQYLLQGIGRSSVADYETALSHYFGVSYAIAFGAGRMALYAILEAMEIGAGDEVILPAYTCVVVPNAILYRQAVPVYVDICRGTFNIDVTKIEAAVTPRTKVIIAQHTFGQPGDIEEIVSLAKKHNLRVIEDCAHAMGATYRGRFLGTFGDAAFNSTDHTKLFSTSTGGFALTSDAQLGAALVSIQSKSAALPFYRKAQIYVQYIVLGILTIPRLFWLGRLLINCAWKFKPWFFFQDEGQTVKPTLYPLTLTPFQAFVGQHELKKLPQNILHRRKTAQELQYLLTGDSTAIDEGAYLRYSILVNSPELWESELGQLFTIGRWFSSVVHGREQNLDAVAYKAGSCPTAEWTSRHTINFPTHFRITPTALKRLALLLNGTKLRANIISLSRP